MLEESDRRHANVASQMGSFRLLLCAQDVSEQGSGSSLALCSSNANLPLTGHRSRNNWVWLEMRRRSAFGGPSSISGLRVLIPGVRKIQSKSAQGFEVSGPDAPGVNAWIPIQLRFWITSSLSAVTHCEKSNPWVCKGIGPTRGSPFRTPGVRFASLSVVRVIRFSLGDNLLS